MWFINKIYNDDSISYYENIGLVRRVVLYNSDTKEQICIDKTEDGLVTDMYNAIGSLPFGYIAEKNSVFATSVNGFKLYSLLDYVNEDRDVPRNLVDSVECLDTILTETPLEPIVLPYVFAVYAMTPDFLIMYRKPTFKKISITLEDLIISGDFVRDYKDGIIVICNAKGLGYFYQIKDRTKFNVLLTKIRVLESKEYVDIE